MVVTSAPSHCIGKRRAGLDRLAVDMNDAGAALAGIAADMGAGQAEMLPQELHQERARLDVLRHRLAVDCHGNTGHSLSTPRAQPRCIGL